MTVSAHHGTAAMPAAHPMLAQTGAPHAGAAHGAHLEPRAPRSGDPRFIDGSTGEFGQSRTIAQQDGPAYGGRKVAKNQNDNDRKQNNYGVTDANFTRTLGVIADPDTGRPMSYAQTMQAYSAAGAIENLAPQLYAQLVANQNAGRGTVLGGALAILGITKSDGANGASLRGIDPAQVNQMRTMQLGNLGSVRDFVLDTVDFKGREWNRAHHSGSAWKSMTALVGKGYDWESAALLTGDSMTSWSGRVLGSNNQDGSESGFAADELAGLKYVALMERATGKPALEDILGAHAATHLPEDQLTNPKINKLIGLPENFRPSTPQEISMVANRIRSWVLQPGVTVNRGEFGKFVEAGSRTPDGQRLAATGLLSSVGFDVERPHNGGNHGGGQQGPTDAQKDAATVPTGLGGGPAQAETDVVTPEARKAVNDQMVNFLLESQRAAANNPLLDDDEEKSAFEIGAQMGTNLLQLQTARSPKALEAAKEFAAKAIADGKLTEQERATLGTALGEAGIGELDQLATGTEKGSAERKRGSAAFDEKLDGAASAQLREDLTSALEDGTLSDEEHTQLDERMGTRTTKAVDSAIEDEDVTKKELTGIAKAIKLDAAEAKAAKRDTDVDSVDDAEGASGDGEDVGATSEADASSADGGDEE